MSGKDDFYKLLNLFINTDLYKLVWHTVLGYFDHTDAMGSFSEVNVIWLQGYKTFFMLTSTEHEIFPAHRC